MAHSKRDPKQEILAFPVQLATQDGAWLEFDGTWSAFNLQVGSDDGGQHFDAIVSTSSFSTWLPTSDGCAIQTLPKNVTLPSNAPRDQADCASSRGVGFFRQQGSPGYDGSKDASQTWQYGGPPVYTDLGADLNASILFGPDYYYRHSHNIDFLFLNSVSSSGVQIESGTTVPILGDYGWLYYLPTIGLGFGKYEFNDTSSFMLSLADNGTIPSQTWGYTAGAHYRDSYAGSLVLGGYDSERVAENTTATFDMPSGSTEKTELKLSVNSISIDFNRISDPNESWTIPFPVIIDSTLPYLFLPKATCQWVADQFNLTWDSATGLYTLDNSTAKNNLLSTQRIRFALAETDSTDQIKTTIEFPYDAFVADASWTWLFPTPQAIFPMRNMTDESDVGVLGRAFLQEAYISANYEPDGQYFNVSQASFPSPAATHIVTIQGSKSIHNENSKSGLKAGAIAGIGIGAAIAVIACIFAIWWFCIRGNKGRGKKEEEEEEEKKEENKDVLETFPSFDRPRTTRRGTADTDWSDRTFGRSEFSAVSPSHPGLHQRNLSELSGEPEEETMMAKIHEMDVQEKDKMDAPRLQNYAARRLNSDSSVPSPLPHEMEGSQDWFRP